MTALLMPPQSRQPLEELVDEARKWIQVEPAEIAEAKRRRALLSTALTAAFPGSRIYLNGSLAHQDALTPLTDVDLGVVVSDPGHEYGPGKKGPGTLQKTAADSIRAALKDEYPKLRVETKNRRRSILVRFSDPVTPGEIDFTADVIVAVDNPDGRGLYIPSYRQWDRSDPETHTRLVRETTDLSQGVFPRVIRLLKHWARRHNKPLCSWHIKALALDVINEPMSLLAGMDAWFTHAVKELRKHDTADPARVAPKPITIPHDLTRLQLADYLENAHSRLKTAIKLDDEGWHTLAHQELADFFNDPEMLAPPTPDVLAREYNLYQQVRRPRPASATPRAWAP